MKALLLMVGGVCAAVAAAVVFLGREEPVVEMAHQLEAAWADHHTVV